MCAETRPRFMPSSERVFFFFFFGGGGGGGVESETMLTPWEAQRRFEPATLHQAGQRAQRATD